MKYRQWKKNYKKLHGVNPPLELDKRKQRRLAKKAVKTISIQGRQAQIGYSAGMMRQIACGQRSLRHMKAGRLENDKIYGRDCRGGRAVCRGSRRKCAYLTGDTGKDSDFNNYASMDSAIQSDKASAGMAGKLQLRKRGG